MQRKDIDKNLQEKKQQEEKKGKVTTKVYKTTKETPNYKESKVEIISNQTIENPPEITRTSNIYQTSTGKKTIEETTEKQSSGTIEKTYIVTTSKHKRNDSDSFDKKNKGYSNIKTPGKNEKIYEKYSTEKNYYILPEKENFSHSSMYSNELKHSSSDKRSSKMKYSTNSERIRNNNINNQNNYSLNNSYAQQSYNFNSPYQGYNNQTYNINNQNQTIMSHSHSNSNQFIPYSNQTYNNYSSLNKNKGINIKTYENPNQNYEFYTQRIKKPIRHIIPSQEMDKELFFNQIKKQGLLDIKDSQTYQIETETRYVKQVPKVERKGRSVGQVIVNSRSKENIRKKDITQKSFSQYHDKYLNTTSNEKKKKRNKGKISNLFGILNKNNNNDDDFIITKGMRNEKGGVVDFAYGSLNRSQSYSFMRFKHNIYYSEKKKRDAAKIIQRWWRKIVYIYHKYERSILLLQSYFRGYLVRRYYRIVLNKQRRMYERIMKERELNKKNKNYNQKIDKYVEIDERNFNYNYDIENTKKITDKSQKEKAIIIPEEEDKEIDDYIYVRNLATTLIKKIIQKRLSNKYYEMLLAFKENNGDNVISENYINIILKKFIKRNDYNIHDLLRNKFDKFKNQVLKDKVQEKDNEKKTILKSKAKAIEDNDKEKENLIKENEKLLKEKDVEKENLVNEKENLIQKYEKLIKDKDKERENLLKEKEKLMKERENLIKERNTEKDNLKKEKDKFLKEKADLLKQKDKEKADLIKQKDKEKNDAL